MKVTAAIFRNGDNVLLMRRGADQPLAGEWEYPGGKFEDGEDGPTCLKRELELSAQLKREYETEINSADDYQSRLIIMQKWFVIVFVG